MPLPTEAADIVSEDLTPLLETKLYERILNIAEQDHQDLEGLNMSSQLSFTQLKASTTQNPEPLLKEKQMPSAKIEQLVKVIVFDANIVPEITEPNTSTRHRQSSFSLPQTPRLLPDAEAFPVTPAK